MRTVWVVTWRDRDGLQSVGVLSRYEAELLQNIVKNTGGEEIGLHEADEFGHHEEAA